MAKVDHNTIAVHLFDDFLTKLTYSTMGVAASCRVAYIIVTIVTKGNIGHTSLCKMLDILKLMF